MDVKPRKMPRSFARETSAEGTKLDHAIGKEVRFFVLQPKRKRGNAAHSKRFATPVEPPCFAKRLECPDPHRDRFRFPREPRDWNCRW